MSGCLGCNQETQWRLTPANHRMILDATPTAETGRGVYVLVGVDSCEPYDPAKHPTDQPRYMSHWATCPNRDKFRRKRKR